MADLEDVPGVEGAEHAAGAAKDKLSRRVGPLPLWGWGVAVVGGFLAWGMLRGGGPKDATGHGALPGAASTPGIGSGGGGGMPPAALPAAPAKSTSTGADTEGTQGINALAGIILGALGANQPKPQPAPGSSGSRVADNTGDVIRITVPNGPPTAASSGVVVPGVPAPPARAVANVPGITQTSVMPSAAAYVNAVQTQPGNVQIVAAPPGNGGYLDPGDVPDVAPASVDARNAEINQVVASAPAGQEASWASYFQSIYG